MGAIKGSAFEAIEKRMEQNFKSENFSNAAECISMLEKFRDEHFGADESETLLYNRLSAEGDHCRDIFEDLVIAKTALASVLAHEDVSKILKLDTRILPDLSHPKARNILAYRGVRPSENGAFKMSSLLGALKSCKPGFDADPLSVSDVAYTKVHLEKRAAEREQRKAEMDADVNSDSSVDSTSDTDK